MNRVYLNGRLPGTLQDLACDVEKAFDEFFVKPMHATSGETPRYMPAVDLVEMEDRFQIAVNLPGVSIDGVKVEVHEDLITISGTRAKPELVEGQKFLRQERPHGEFSRKLTLPENIDQERIEASFDAGVLSIVVPKSPKVQPRQVQIKTGTSPA